MKGIEQGIEQGIERGIEQGKDLERKEIVMNMLKKCFDLELIMEVTGLTEDEVKKYMQDQE